MISVEFIAQALFNKKLCKEEFKCTLGFERDDNHSWVKLEILPMENCSKAHFIGFIQSISDNLVSFSDMVVKQITTPGYLKIDFSNALLVGYSGTFDQVVFTLSEAEVTKENILNGKPSICTYYLSNSAEEIVYRTASNFDWEGKWEDITERPFYTFNNIKYQFTYFYEKEGQFEKGGNQIVLKRIPILRIGEAHMFPEEVLKFFRGIRVLASFFLSQHLNYYLFEYSSKGHIVYRMKTQSLNSIRKSSFSTNFKFLDQFLDSVENPDLIYKDLSFWENIIDKFLLGRNYISGESAFLVNYNILEFLFDYLRSIGIISFRAENKFKVKSDTLYKDLCRKFIKAVAENLIEGQDRFLSRHENLSFKEYLIKDYTSGSEKIQVLLEKLSIQPEEVGIVDLRKEIINVRNCLVHPSDQSEVAGFKASSERLSKLVNLAVLRFFNSSNHLNPIFHSPNPTLNIHKS